MMTDNHIYLACAHCGRVTVFEQALKSWHICRDTGSILNDDGEQVLWTEAKEALSGDIGIAATDETWNLIAAAPDLLAACKEIILNDDGIPPWSHIYDMCKAAIAKATNASPLMHAPTFALNREELVTLLREARDERDEARRNLKYAEAAARGYEAERNALLAACDDPVRFDGKVFHEPQWMMCFIADALDERGDTGLAGFLRAKAARETAAIAKAKADH
jgi:hypothetical protein